MTLVDWLIGDSTAFLDVGFLARCFVVVLCVNFSLGTVRSFLKK